MRKTELKALDENMRNYRRRFPFRCSEGERCVLFEENEEFSVKIYSVNACGDRMKQTGEEFLSCDAESQKQRRICLDRQGFSFNGTTSVRLFSEHPFSADSDAENVYYTLQICDKNGANAVFRAFCANKEAAERLFEALCASDVDCRTAIDFYCEMRAQILRELWFYGF